MLSTCGKYIINIQVKILSSTDKTTDVLLSITIDAIVNEEVPIYMF